MMKILVVAAMPSELKAIKEGIKSAKLKEKLDIDYLCCGIGNYETISSLENYLTRNSEPVFIWNIGICGYWNSNSEKESEPVFIWNIGICGYWDSNSEKESEPIQVASVMNIHIGKEMIIPPFLQIAPLKYCFCSENVILEKPEIGDKNEEMYFDMESRGIEFVASKYKFPRLILKVPFDFVGENGNVNGKKYGDLSEKISELLVNLPYHEYLGKILDWISHQ